MGTLEVVVALILISTEIQNLKYDMNAEEKKNQLELKILIERGAELKSRVHEELEREYGEEREKERLDSKPNPITTHAPSNKSYSLF